MKTIRKRGHNKSVVNQDSNVESMAPSIGYEIDGMEDCLTPMGEQEETDAQPQDNPGVDTGSG